MVAVAAIESGFSKIQSALCTKQISRTQSCYLLNNKVRHRYSGFVGSDSGDSSWCCRQMSVALGTGVDCSRTATEDWAGVYRDSAMDKAVAGPDCCSTFAAAGRGAPEQRSHMAVSCDAALKVHLSAPRRPRMKYVQTTKHTDAWPK